jgi:hypothetical protein
LIHLQIKLLGEDEQHLMNSIGVEIVAWLNPVTSWTPAELHIHHISFSGGDLEQGVHPPSATVVWLFAQRTSRLIAGGRGEGFSKQFSRGP